MEFAGNNKLKTKLYFIFGFYIYIAFLLLLFYKIPWNILADRHLFLAVAGLGLISVWRYLWWMTHLVRSIIYSKITFPSYRKDADQLWASDWRPKSLYILMTTFREIDTTTEKVLNSLLAMQIYAGIPVNLFIGIGEESDRNLILLWQKRQPKYKNFTIKITFQKKPGKRYALSETLREIIKHGLTKDDPVIFLDGDTVLPVDTINKCLPFFKFFDKLQAMTTHERATVNNAPPWFKKWIQLRFIQRDFTMRSHALSKKVLTLTGRMSIFRGKHLLESGFLQVLENDSLNHWLWGRYRFLSGDDKSTWYYLLKSKANMLYIPDVSVTTIENIKGSSAKRMFANLHRWCGNTLRNGARAIALGPRKVGWYIWWCIVDQRIAMWTMPVGLFVTIIAGVYKSSAFFLISLLWILISRFCICMVFFLFSGKLDPAFPIVLYLNQLSSSVMKILLLFNPPQQRWQNRGNQSNQFDKLANFALRKALSNLVALFYCAGFIIIILSLQHIIFIPSINDIKSIFY